MSGVRCVVGGLVMNDQERPTAVLAARRTSPPELAGRWEFPGGKVEPGESPEQALRRELHEELAIDVRVGRELLAPGGGGWPISDRWELRLYFVEVVTGTAVAGDAHDEIAWLGPDSLESVSWLDADRAALPFLRARWGQ